MILSLFEYLSKILHTFGAKTVLAAPFSPYPLDHSALKEDLYPGGEAWFGTEILFCSYESSEVLIRSKDRINEVFAKLSYQSPGKVFVPLELAL